MRPPILAPDLRICARIAKELGFRKHWVVWNLAFKGGRWTKPPLMVDGSNAKSNDPATWCHFDTAAAAVGEGRFDGLGFVVSPDDPFLGVDVDECIHANSIASAVRSIIRDLDSYTERSPSGNGVRIIVRARKPGAAAQTTDVPGTKELCLFDRARFLTLTGRPIADKPIAERQAQITALYRWLWPNEPSEDGSPIAVAGGPSTIDERHVLLYAFDLDPELRALYHGRWFGGRWVSQSEADASFCYKLLDLGFAPDAVQRLFRESKLYRQKTDSRRGGDTYLTRTISRMAARVAERYP